MDDVTTHTAAKAPPISKFAEIHLGSRDLAESELFYTDVLGGKVIERGKDKLRVRFTNIDYVFTPGTGYGAASGAEYPHYAFTVTPEQFAGIKRRCDAFQVKTNEPWTRLGDHTDLLSPGHALMYFRDPSGNQFELFSPTGCTLLPLRIGKKSGGDYVTDFHALAYDKIVPPAPDKAPPLSPPTGYNHMTIPVKDLAEAKRFLVSVLGGKVILDMKHHVQVVIGGAEVGVAPLSEGWTRPDARLPHYTFVVEPNYLLPLKQQLESFGVPTHDIATSDGVDAFLYFRDPSGNLFQLLCPKGFTGATRRAKPEDIDVKPLNYSKWKDPIAA